MKHLLILGPALLLVFLTACGSAPSDTATTETAATAETAATWTVGKMEPLYSANSQGYYRTTYREREGGNTVYAYDLITRVSFDTLEEEVLCHLPGCEHDTPDCVSYINIQTSDVILAQEDGSVLVYHAAFSDQSGQNMLESYQEILNDPARLEEAYPGEAGKASVQDCLDMLQQPSYVDRISADGLTRERLVTLPEGVNPGLVCRDENALYGIVKEGVFEAATNIYGVRIGLDGQVDTFSIPDPDYTTLLGGWNGQLVLCHTRSPVDMNTMYLYGNYDGYYALIAQDTHDCWLYDPATGAVDKIRLPDRNVELWQVVGDQLLYNRKEAGRYTLCAYDLMTGEARALCEESNMGTDASPVQNLGGMPHFVVSYLNGSITTVELSTGLTWSQAELGEMAEEIPAGFYVNRPVCETADGNLLLELYSNSYRNPIYLMVPSPVTPEEDAADVSASLQAIQDYLQVTQDYEEAAEEPSS